MPYVGKYIPEKNDLYKLSRSKVDNFLNCQRCFYLDRRMGIGHPQGFPFNLNSAVDNLLKNEFDYYRNIKKPHPYIERLGLNAVPFEHENLDNWRNNFSGVVYQHERHKLHLFGAIDDIWIDLDSKELIVVDYKATSKNGEINLDADWQIGYKRQMEFYQYLLRNNGFNVSNTGYFVYCNGRRKKQMFDEKLEFDISLLDYTGDDSWIEKTLSELICLLRQDNIPSHNQNCDYCRYQIETANYS